MVEEIIAEKFPILRTELYNLIQEAQRIPSTVNPNKRTLRHILIKMVKVKGRDKIWRAARSKQKFI